MRYRFPGFVDVHVHFRDPGMPDAETTRSGLMAAERGGFAAVVTMPNTRPACDSVEAMNYQRAKARRIGSNTKLFTSACITVRREGKKVAELEKLAEGGAAFFTDDGTFVRNARIMESAMKRAYALNMVICQHALAPNISEAAAIRRDLELCRVTGCRLHIQHISTALGVEAVREAQREGLPVTAEATPHHLLLCRDDIKGDDGNYKMAPPLAEREDRAEVRRAVKDGILMLATDHAPHPQATKNCGYERAANGIVGLETAIPITYAVMVEEEGMSIEDWARAWYEKPKDIFKCPEIGETVIEIGKKRKVDIDRFVGLSRNCPYGGMEFSCWPKEVVCR